MRRVLLAILLLLPLSASAQFNGCPTGFCAPTSTGGTASPTITPGANVPVQHVAFGSPTVTFHNMNGGTNYPAGAVVYAFFVGDQSMYTFVSAGFGLAGVVTATPVAGASDSSGRCWMVQATMPGVSQIDDFTITLSNSEAYAGAAGGYFQNLASSTRDAAANETYGGGTAPNGGSDPQNFNTGTNPSVTATGFGVGFVGSNTAGTLTGVTWTNTTSGSGDTFATVAANMGLSTAHTTTTGTWNPGATGAGSNMNFNACMSGATYH